MKKAMLVFLTLLMLQLVFGAGSALSESDLTTGESGLMILSQVSDDEYIPEEDEEDSEAELVVEEEEEEDPEPVAEEEELIGDFETEE